MSELRSASAPRARSPRPSETQPDLRRPAINGVSRKTTTLDKRSITRDHGDEDTTLCRQQGEVSMRRVLTMAGAFFLFGCATSFAQVAPTPGMGATSPLGTMNFNGPSGPIGIPLGATELNSGGTSPPAGGTLCTGTAASSGGTAGSTTGMSATGTGMSATGSGMSATGTGMSATGSGVAGSMSTFDGGGAPLGSMMGSTCPSGAAAGSPSMAATPSSGLGLGTRPGGSTIPLGSTQLASPGVSAPMGVPVPSVSDIPCPGTSTIPGSTMPGTLGSVGTMSTNGC